MPIPPTDPPAEVQPFADLLALYTSDPETPPLAEIVSLPQALVAGDDPWRIISYLSGLGIFVRTLDDLLRINEDDSEEELHAWHCREGVAISVASDNAWVLFIGGEP